MDDKLPFIRKRNPEFWHSQTYFSVLSASIAALLMVLGLYVFMIYRWQRLESLEFMEWEKFKKDYERELLHLYDLDEEVRRNIFYENLKSIKEHNLKYETGEISFRTEINAFSDMSLEEYHERVSCVSSNEPDLSSMSNYPYPHDYFNAPSLLPSFVDWRNKNCVTPVKRQFGCGSCWAFSSTGALEGLFAIKTKRLTSLSEQNLIDCSTQFGSCMCNGGTPIEAFLYVMKNGGIDSESSYPYKGKSGTCRYKNSSSVGTISGYSKVQYGNETALKYAVAMTPVTAAIDARHNSFKNFKGHGIYYEPKCETSKNLTHSVLVIGYGTESGKDYWLVKNSWGTNWGMGGYIKMSRNRKNNCGIATKASFPNP